MPEDFEHIVLVTSNYWPEKHGISVFTQDLIRTLRERGANPVVVTGLPYFPLGEFLVKTSRKGLQKFGPFGEEVFRYKHWIPRKSDAVSRVMFEFATMTKGLIRSLDVPKREFSKVVVYVPNLSGAIIGLFLAKRLRLNSYIYVQDISSLALRQINMPGAKYFTKLSKVIESAIYSRFDNIATISPYMREILESDFSLSNVSVIPNYTVKKTQKSAFSALESRAKLNLRKSDFLVVFTGSIGYKTNLEILINSARLTKEKDIKYLIVGSGLRIDYFRNLASGLKNILFLPSVADDDYPILLSCADVFFLGEYDTQLGMSLPSKLLGYLNQEKPIIAAVPNNGPTAHFLEENSMMFNPNDSESLAKEICYLYQDKDYYEKRSAQSSSIAVRRGTLEEGVNKLVAWISSTKD